MPTLTKFPIFQFLMISISTRAISAISLMSFMPAFIIWFRSRCMLHNLSAKRVTCYINVHSNKPSEPKRNIKTISEHKKGNNQLTRLDFLWSLVDPWDFLDRSFSFSSTISSELWCRFLCFLILSSPDLLFSLQAWSSVSSAYLLSAKSFLNCSSFSLSRPSSFSLLCLTFLLSFSSLSFSFFACRI